MLLVLEALAVLPLVISSVLVALAMSVVLCIVPDMEQEESCPLWLASTSCPSVLVSEVVVVGALAIVLILLLIFLLPSLAVGGIPAIVLPLPLVLSFPLLPVAGTWDVMLALPLDASSLLEAAKASAVVLVLLLVSLSKSSGMISGLLCFLQCRPSLLEFRVCFLPLSEHAQHEGSLIAPLSSC